MAYSIGSQDVLVVDQVLRPYTNNAITPTIITDWPLCVRDVQTGAPGLTGTGFRPTTGQLYPRGVR
jgi:hypothetical protein